MAKARSRTAARKVKDKWKAKSWYNIIAPSSFDNVTIADTLSDNPEKLINRVTEISLQDLTNDFRKSHIKLFFKIHHVEESNAHSVFVGHTLTSDYLRRMIRRKRSKVDGVYDVKTKDGAKLRVKPFATTDKRVQNSQRKIVRETMKKTIADQALKRTLSEFMKDIIDGKLGSDIYKGCKKLYPVRRVEVYKTEVLSPPTTEMEEEKVFVKEKEPEPKKDDVEEPKETKDKKTDKKKDESVEEESKEETSEDDSTEESKEEKPKKKEKTSEKKVKAEEKSEPKEEISEDTKEDKEKKSE
jgi:small subunit ribosomal protein S3Ae